MRVLLIEDDPTTSKMAAKFYTDAEIIQAKERAVVI